MHDRWRRQVRDEDRSRSRTGKLLDDDCSPADRSCARYPGGSPHRSRHDWTARSLRPESRSYERCCLRHRIDAVRPIARTGRLRSSDRHERSCRPATRSSAPEFARESPDRANSSRHRLATRSTTEAAPRQPRAFAREGLARSAESSATFRVTRSTRAWSGELVDEAGLPARDD